MAITNKDFLDFSGLQTYDGKIKDYINHHDDDTLPSAYCDTASSTAAKVAVCTNYEATANSYINVLLVNDNSAEDHLSLNINGEGAYPIYINGLRSSFAHYTLPAGSYIVYFDGTNYYFRTDGKLTGVGLVDVAGSSNKFLRSDGTWQEVGGSGAASVSITPSLSTGTKIADFTINGSSGILYAPTGGGGGSSSLSGLDDVSLSSLSDGQILKYDSDTSKWVNTHEATNNSCKVYYGSCSTAGDSQVKIATIPSAQNFVLETGALIYIKFTYDNTFAVTAEDHISLNVNGTGAKEIRYGAETATTGTSTGIYGAAKYIMEYMYDGTYWIWVGKSGDSNTTYTNMSESEMRTGTSTTGRTICAARLKTITNERIDTKIGALDVTGESGIAASKTISAWSETDGKVSLTTQDISITTSQISNFPTITDENVRQHYIGDTTNMLPILLANSDTTSGDDEINKVNKNQNFRIRPGNSSNSTLLSIRHVHPTSDAAPIASQITMGQAADSNTGGSHAYLRMYGRNDYYFNLVDGGSGLTGNLTASRSAYFPNRTGILATTNIIAETDETGRTTASKAYAVGDHFMKDNYYCTVTSAIASGATLTENTNYVKETDVSNYIDTNLAGKLDNSQATMGDWMVIERSTTTSADNPATLSFKTNDTTANVTNYSRIYAYSPHSGTGGNNLVINTAGKLYVGSGESAKSLYDNHKSLEMSMTNEYAYYLSDSHLYVLANGNTITDAKGFILTTGFNLTPYGFKTDVTPNAWGQLDNAGNIGTSSSRWASGNFVTTNSTNINTTNINGVAVGSSPKFTDTTYESKAAASGGTAVSLCTTGEKYTWNNKSDLALGTTSTTAYRGDRGASAYTHAVTNKGSAFSSGLYKITTNSEGHVTAATAVEKADITALGIPAEDTNTVPSAYCATAAGTAAKTATCTDYALLDDSYILVTIKNSNTKAGALTLNINSAGAKSIYINGSASSSSNYTLPAGTYLVKYTSSRYYFRTDGKITGDITGDAATVNGKTVGVNVPSNAVFTDTDTKVTQTLLSTQSNINYGIILSDASVTSSAATTTNTVNKTSGFYYNPSTGKLNISRVHTSTTSAQSYIYLGNATADGTAGSSYGDLLIYGRGTKYGHFVENLNTSISANRAYYLPNKSGYMQVGFEYEATKTLSTSADTTFTFTDSTTANIPTTAAVDVYSSIYGFNPTSVSITSAGTCTVVFPKYSSAASLTCRIIIHP